MSEITFTIPTDKIQRVISTMKGLYEIPKIVNPEYDPENPGTTEPLINEYSDSEWAKEVVRRWIVDQVQEYEQRIAIEAAKDSVSKDDSLVN